ncbi:hypothetical protein MPH_07184 [Macrophomina phaseolina MS6]|uniref:Uncharacterized protein n=1 Tax=Macrophomina phaseolina (strain MS6) TaxID=1126212 RepID=K2RZU2_MACPH|nr:hypothetical protein MPH_07184 [Macrophomina phaseolina MS6]
MDTSEFGEGTTSPQPDLQRPGNDEARDNEESTTSRSQPSQGEPDEEYTDYNLLSGEGVKLPKHCSWTWLYNGHRWVSRAKISTAEAYQELQIPTAEMPPEDACAFYTFI